MAAPDLDVSRDELRAHLGTTDDADAGLDNDACDLLLNRSFWQLQNMFGFRETEESKTFPTTAGTRRYSVPSPFEALKLLSIEDPNTLEHTTLDRMTEWEYENVYSADPDREGKPQKYFREGSCIRLWPTPDIEYTLTIRYQTTLADFDDGNVDFPLPATFWEILMLGAVWRGWLRFKNTTASAEIKQQQIALLKDAVPVEGKEEVDSHMSGLMIAGYDTDEIYGAHYRI